MQAEETNVQAKKHDALRFSTVRIHMENHSDLSIQAGVRKQETDTSDVIAVVAAPFEGEIRLVRERETEALCFKGLICGRENPQGYPYSFRRACGVELVLKTEQEAPFMAVAQHKAWWTRPYFGSRLSEVPEKTQLLIRKTGMEYEVFLTVCGGSCRADLCGNEEGLLLSLSGSRMHAKQLSGIPLVYGRGRDPYRILENCFRLAKKLDPDLPELRQEKNLPEMFEGIGWCTWDSLGQDVSEEAIFQKMDEFLEKGISVRWVLIDDGWSEVNRETLKLRSLNADPDRFPHGLAGTVQVLKEKYQVSYVGVWQAMKGYWYGIEENSEAHRMMAPYLTRYGNGELTAGATAADSFGFWNRWHRQLRQEGIDFVKIDGQGSVPAMLAGDTAHESAVRNLHTGLEASVFLNFSGNMINCMGMAPENVWGRTRSAVSRSSDDYTPTISGSIVEHLLQNAYDSVYQGNLYYNDWDMFWTDHEETGYSAIMRAVSGGPVYISDACGKTDRKMLDRLTRTDGSLLKCDGTPVLSMDCLTENRLANGQVMKVCNTCRDQIYVACFTWDVPEDGAEGVIRKEDIPGLTADRYLVLDRTAGCVCVCDDHTDYSFRQGMREARMLLLAPEEEITVFGIGGKYIAGAAVRKVCTSVGGCEVETVCTVEADCAGDLVFYTKKEVKQILVNGESAKAEMRQGLYSLHLEKEKSVVRIQL